MFSFESAWHRPEKDKTKKRVYCNILKKKKKKKKKKNKNGPLGWDFLFF